jgi:hypothetical protein
MKKMIMVFAVASVFAACGNKQEKTLGTEAQVPVETPKQQVVVKKEVHYVPVNNSATQPAQEKKGWSKAAKGAVIGAGTGAVVGAIVSDKKAKGAIIGAAAGAGAGYIIGRSKDRKDGRVQ